MFWIRREQIFNGQEVYSVLYFLVYFNQVFKTPPSLIILSRLILAPKMWLFTDEDT